VSSQIVQRDRHADFSRRWRYRVVLDKFAQEIRLLQRTEVREAEEYFSPPEGIFRHAA
jgi:adenylosuccinate lyase